MSRPKPRGTKKERKEQEAIQLSDDIPPVPRKKPKTPLEPRTHHQRSYITSMVKNQITFGIGPAGVGKTYCAARMAAQLYEKREIDKILLTRPAVESGRSIGFLPGEMDEKFAPYIAAYKPGFVDELGEGKFDYLVRQEKIEICPLNFMQGLSWDDSVMVLFDEAENATAAEMKMFLTRIGEGARVVIDGDPEQAMIHQSGLIDAVHRIGYLDGVSVVRFTRDDIVRSGLCRQILDAYDDDMIENNVMQLPGFIRNGRQM